MSADHAACRAQVKDVTRAVGLTDVEIAGRIHRDRLGSAVVPAPEGADPRARLVELDDASRGKCRRIEVSELVERHAGRVATDAVVEGGIQRAVRMAPLDLPVPDTD